MMKISENDFSLVLPILSYYAIAGYKLLPAVNQIYEALTKIKGNAMVLDLISEDIIRAQHHPRVSNNNETEIISFNDAIVN